MRISDWSSDVCSSDLPRHRKRCLPGGSVGRLVALAVAPPGELAGPAVLALLRNHAADGAGKVAAAHPVEHGMGNGKLAIATFGLALLVDGERQAFGFRVDVRATRQSGHRGLRHRDHRTTE